MSSGTNKTYLFAPRWLVSVFPTPNAGVAVPVATLHYMTLHGTPIVSIGTNLRIIFRWLKRLIFEKVPVSMRYHHGVDKTGSFFRTSAITLLDGIFILTSLNRRRFLYILAFPKKAQLRNRIELWVGSACAARKGAGIVDCKYLLFDRRWTLNMDKSQHTSWYACQRKKGNRHVPRWNNDHERLPLFVIIRTAQQYSFCTSSF